MPPKYASKTKVPMDRTRSEIESVITKYGATQFGYLNEPGRAIIVFQCRERRIRFVLELPLLTDKQFKTDAKGRTLEGAKQLAAWEQATRQKWRALLLSIKAKLEAVNSGIVEFEEEFLAQIIDPETNQTIYQAIREPIKQRYLGNAGGPLLLEGPKEPRLVEST